MRKWRPVTGVSALCMLCSATVARADSIAPPRSYTQTTPGGKFVFVMITPTSVETETSNWNGETAARIREIRRTYTRSGMYRNDGSAKPLWTVDWYAHAVHLAPDGIHLIRPCPWAWLRDDNTPDLNVEAVSFFANGQLLRTYRVGELVDAPGGFRRSVSHYWWQQEGRLSGEFEYTIVTEDGNRFVFDIRTGEIVSASRAGRVLRRGWPVGIGVAVVAVAAWFVWRGRSRSRRAGAEPGVTPDPAPPA